MTRSDRSDGTGRAPARVGPTAAAALLLLAAATTGCAGSPGPEDGSPSVTAPDTVTGSVRQVGSSPFVRTVVEGSDTATVTGDLESEISRLSGARVQVIGTLASSGERPGPELEAAAYEILSVDGRRPEVGVLRSDGDATYLVREGEDDLRLRAVSSGLAGRTGAKVWVVTGEDGAVQRYGVLRPPEQ